MSKGTIVKKSGGGGELFAAIVASYPIGSVCTCSNGVKTLKADDVSGIWVFQIPEAEMLPEVWRVTSTNGTESASVDVEIKSKFQSERVALEYSKYIFKSGDGAQVALSTSLEDSQCFVTITADKISMGWQSKNRTKAYSTAEKHDLTNYSRLEVEYTCSDAGSGAYNEAFGVSTVKVSTGTTANNLNVTNKAMTATSAKRVDYLDISALTGAYYLGACGAGKSDTYNFRLL